MTDLATIRIPVDSSDMVQAVRESKNLERGIKMLVDAFDAGVIGASQFGKGLLQLKREYQDLFTSSQQATAAVRGHAKSLQESATAAEQAAVAKNNLAMATKKAETAFALANQKAKEELQTLRNRAEFAWAMAMQREQESQKAVQAAERQAQAEAKLAAEILRRRKTQEASATTNAAAFQSQIGPNLGLGAQGISAGASASAFEAEIERLRTKYDQIYASSQLYEKSLAEINQAHTVGVLSVKQHEAAVESLNVEYQNFQNGIALAGNRFAQHVNQTSTGMNKFGVAAQQTGYQVSDFLVQVQSGTNPLVAFSQQATQLAGLLYLMPERFQLARLAVLGFSVSVATAISVVTIGIPLLAMLAMSFFNSGEKADKAAEGVDRYKKALDDLKFATETVQADINKLTFGTEDPAIANARQRQKDAQEEIAKLKAEAMRITARGVIFDPTDEQKAAIENALTGYRDITVELNNLIFKQSALNEAQSMLNGGLSVAAGIQKGVNYDRTVELRLAKEQVKADEQAASVARLKKSVFHAMANEMGAVSFAVLESLNAQKALNAALSSGDAEQFNRAINDALAAGVKFSQTDLNSIVALAARNGWSLAGALRAAAQAAQVGPIVNADPSMGPGFENRGKLRGSSRQATYQPTFSEIYNREIEKAAGGGGGGAKTDPLEELRQQIKLETELLGVSEAQARVIQALGQDRSKYSQAEIAAITAEIEAYMQKQEAVERTKQIMDTVKSSMEDAFMSMVDGTKSAKDAFKSMAAEIIKELYRVLVVQRMVGAISGAFGGGGGLGLFTGPSTGSFGLPFGGARATGGPIEAHKAYLVGEKGPELVIPRQSGTVVNAAQTAQAMGKGSGDVTVNNNITVTGSDAAMVRTEIAKMIPQITNATKAAVIDAKQRGGQMAAAFR